MSYLTPAVPVSLVIPLPPFFPPSRPSQMASGEREEPRKGVKNRDAGLVFLPGSKQSRAISLSLQKLFIFANCCVGPKRAGGGGVLLVVRKKGLGGLIECIGTSKCCEAMGLSNCRCTTSPPQTQKLWRCCCSNSAQSLCVGGCMVCVYANGGVGGGSGVEVASRPRASSSQVVSSAGEWDGGGSPPLCL